MAKLLLSCDDHLFYYKGKYYYKNQDWFLFYQRYLRVFENLRIVNRCCRIDELGAKMVPVEDDTIEIVDIPDFHGPKQYIKQYYAIGAVLRGATKGCDAAVLRIPSTIAMRVGKQVQKRGIPYACEVVYDAEDAWRGNHGLVRLLWKRIDKRMRLLCAGAEGVSCVTEHYLQKHYYPLKNSSFTEHYSSLALPQEFYGTPKSFPSHKPFIIAHTANQVQFNGRKGYNQLIEALKLLKQRGVEVIVRFAGGDYNDGVSRLTEYAEQLGVRDMIRFMGYLTRKELDSFLSNADLYVMPTKAEGLPRVIIEAMAKGLPCITTPVSGNPELIEDQFLVDYYDINTLAIKIRELLSNKQLYEETSKLNFHKSLEYEASVLQNRRDGFYSKLKSRVI